MLDTKGIQIHWRHLIYPYIKNEGVFKCPSMGQCEYAAAQPVSARRRWRLLRVQQLQMSWGTAVDMASMARPADASPWPSGAAPPTGRPIPRTGCRTLPSPRHRGRPAHGGRHYVFCDGHVKWLRHGTDVTPVNLWDPNKK